MQGPKHVRRAPFPAHALRHARAAMHALCHAHAVPRVPRTGARQQQLQALSTAPGTLVFYAPPHGLVAILTDMAQVLGGQRRVCVARELTKVHEELFRWGL